MVNYDAMLKDLWESNHKEDSDAKGEAKASGPASVREVDKP